MFEEHVPKRKIGVLSPLPIIDNEVCEFYRLVPDGVMMVAVLLRLQEFSRAMWNYVLKRLRYCHIFLQQRLVDFLQRRR